MEAKRPCPACSGPIPAYAVACPLCGANLSPAQGRQDAQHLQLLSVFHYVVAALTALTFSFPIIHIAIGVFVIIAPESIPSDRGGPPPALVGWFFVIIGGAVLLAGWTLAVLLAVAGRSIATRRRHLFCLIVAGISCLVMPFGTVLGVFTFVVLLRPTVKALFQA